MKPYNCHAEPPTNPPELSDEEWDKNNRNSIRQEAIEALKIVIDRLDELEHDGDWRGTQKYMERLITYLANDMEDWPCG